MEETKEELREKAIQMVIDAHVNGHLPELGWHRACKHADTIRAKAECYVRREVMRKKRENANRPSAVCGRYGRIVHDRNKFGTYTKPPEQHANA